jgi:hypothetical protein
MVNDPIVEVGDNRDPLTMEVSRQCVDELGEHHGRHVQAERQGAELIRDAPEGEAQVTLTGWMDRDVQVRVLEIQLESPVPRPKGAQDPRHGRHSKVRSLDVLV